MVIEATIANTAKEVAINVTNHIVNNLPNVTNHIVNHLPNDTINVTVQTGTNDFWHLVWEAVTAIGTVAVPIIIAVLTKTYSRKQNEHTAITFVFNTINSTPHKSAEENIYDAYREDRLMMNGGLNRDHANPADVVKRNYDQIGMMIHNNLIPRIQYYQTFGVITIVSYFVLKESIESERKEHKLHMAYFTNLAIDCFEFWDAQYDKPTITDPKLKVITKDMLGEKIDIPKKRKSLF